MTIKSKQCVNLATLNKPIFQCVASLEPTRSHRFFLDGVASAATEAERNIIDVASLIADDRKQLLKSPKASVVNYRLVEMLPTMPRFSAEHARQQLATTFPTVSAAISAPQELGIVKEITGQK